MRIQSVRNIYRSAVQGDFNCYPYRSLSYYKIDSLIEKHHNKYVLIIIFLIKWSIIWWDQILLGSNLSISHIMAEYLFSMAPIVNWWDPLWSSTPFNSKFLKVTASEDPDSGWASLPLRAYGHHAQHAPLRGRWDPPYCGGRWVRYRSSHFGVWLWMVSLWCRSQQSTIPTSPHHRNRSGLPTDKTPICSEAITINLSLQSIFESISLKIIVQPYSIIKEILI